MSRRQPTVPLRALVIISLVVLAVLLLASAGVASGGDTVGRDSSGSEASQPAVDHQVRSGDTLWSIAAGHADPGTDVRAVIAEIRLLNDLDTTVIHPGQTLQLPPGD